MSDQPGVGATPVAPQRSGVLPAIIVMTLWAGHLAAALMWTPVPSSASDATVGAWIRVVAHVLVQAYLYTGLFITAHDSMHGTVSRNRGVNLWIGRITAFLFAAFSYKRLLGNHMKHHRWPGEAEDPDFSVKSQNFFVWFVVFFSHYATVVQVLIMAAIFNLLKLVVPTANLILFWIIPAFLATFQLFYFGTYLPHRLPHTEQMGPHHARTQRRSHAWAMLSCYFFGYHREHHESPRTPWWQLHRLKSRDP